LNIDIEGLCRKIIIFENIVNKVFDVKFGKIDMKLKILDDLDSYEHKNKGSMKNI
jgi:hypothetical protein